MSYLSELRLDAKVKQGMLKTVRKIGGFKNEKDYWKIQYEDIAQMILDLFEMNPRTLPSKIKVRHTHPGGN